VILQIIFTSGKERTEDYERPDNQEKESVKTLEPMLKKTQTDRQTQVNR
jgi:hypothetical protein